MKIAVLGAGAWGTALSIALCGKHRVHLWARDAARVAALRQARVNSRYLPDRPLPTDVIVEDDVTAALSGADLALLAADTSGLAALAADAAVHAPGVPIIWACKGFDRRTGALPHETVTAAVPATTPVGVLSGPSFADEVAAGLPCALTVASHDEALSKRLAQELSFRALRVYSSADLVGVELGGALKNVMAIAAGISDGMKLGLNARAALITRGLTEIARLGVAMGGKPETFMGLTGLGDLVLTATGHLSRNRTVGLLLAEGRGLDEILTQLGHVAEGVNSAATTLARARALGVDMPITEAVNAILFSGARPRDVLTQLLARDVKAE